EEFGITNGLDQDVIYREALANSLELFARLGVTATYFVVGKDLSLASCRDFCREAIQQGHSIANHSFSHYADFWRRPPEEKRVEIRACHDAIAECISVPPVGFRAPGYYFDRDIAEALMELGYAYDSSVVPGGYCALLALYMRLRGARTLDKRF